MDPSEGQEERYHVGVPQIGEPYRYCVSPLDLVANLASPSSVASCSHGLALLHACHCSSCLSIGLSLSSVILEM